jgi:DNA-binding XRE family transcriptional regulator
MPVLVDLNNLPPFPKRIPEKLKTIREHFKLSPDEIAPKVGAQTGAEILAYENNEDDLLVTVLWNYSKLAGCPMDQILYDNLEITALAISLEATSYVKGV